MRRVEKPLTAQSAARKTMPGRYADGGGLYLQVTPATRGDGVVRSWLMRYMIDGRARMMGLGSFEDFTLQEARERARKERQKLADGIDPIDARDKERDERRSEAAKRITFRDAASAYIKAHRAGWKNGKHSDQWENTLEADAYPVIGDLSVAAIDVGHVMRVLEPVWLTKTVTASRLRGRIEAVLDWATARGYRRGDNPARWRGHLDNLLPAKAKVSRTEHHPAMPYADLPAFMAELRGTANISARALEFTILTGARTSETTGARWQEIDLTAKVWNVPGSRTKSGRDHRVPLSDRAAEILKGLPRERGNEHVFPGARAGQGLSNMAMLELLRGMREGLTVHGFRSTFRDWAAEQTNYPREIAEAALAHVLKDKTEAAYQRGDLLEKRRRLMAEWDRYCSTPPAADRGGVVSMRGRAS